MTTAYDHPDYPPWPKSPRRKAADFINDKLIALGLALPREPQRSPDGKFWEIVLHPNEVGSGKVRVYGESYVYVALFVSLVGCDEKIDRVYGSDWEAAAYVAALLRDRDVEAADAVPQKVPKKIKGIA
jgi:hypothetical protein